VAGPFRKCCMGCGGTTKQFFEMPLSMYVILSLGASAYYAFSANAALTAVKTCEGSNFLYLIMGFSALYAVFSVYAQCKVWGTIVGDGVFPESTDKWSNMSFKSRIDDFTRETTAAAAKGDGWMDQGKGLLNKAAEKGRDAAGVAKAEANEEVKEEKPEKRIVPQEVVQQAFKMVFNEDLGVLAMFAALLAMCFIGFKGPTLIDGADSKCVPGGVEMAPQVYFGLSSLFAFAYMCCACCSKSVSIAKEEDPEE